uniref:Dynamin-type G domain-containing protein n=1 Tax=Anopheles atroparvus TaxID=41427 RepID=A0AAG5CS20_ANOAO
MQRISVWVLLGLALFTLSASGLHVSAEAPTEYECRPYIEKAIQDLKTESAEVPDSNASTEDPIDVTSQEEDDNTAAEELSIEETDAAADDASEEITPSEEVQEQLFAENGDENAADSEPADDGEDDDDDDDDKEESDKVQVSEETGADQDEEATESEETVTESEEQADETNEEANASEEAELAASEEGEDSEDAPTVSEETASEESANQVLENSAEDDEDDEEDDEDEGEDDEAADATNEEPQSDEQLTESQEQPSSTEADEEDVETVNSAEAGEAEAIDSEEEKVGTEKAEKEEDDDADDDDDDDNEEQNNSADLDNENGDDLDEENAVKGSYDDREGDTRENNTEEDDEEDDAEQEEDDNSGDDQAIDSSEDSNVEGTNSEEDEEEDTTAGLSGEDEETVADDTVASDEEEAPLSTEEEAEPVSEETVDAADSTEDNGEEDDEDTEVDGNGDAASEEDEGNGDSAEGAEEDEQSEEVTTTDSQEQEPAEEPSAEAVEESAEADSATAEGSEETAQEAVEESAEEQPESTEQTADSVEEQTVDEEVSEEEATLKADSAEGTSQEGEQVTEEASEETASEPKGESFPEEDLLLEYEIPTNLRDTSHIYELLNINDEASAREKALQDTADVILRDLKRIYDNSIKPLETLYKYRDLSNRHFGDPEIFSKPLVLFMGPWSGGKSTILNYLTHNEYTPNSVRTGAEPSPAYFNILMHGNEPEVLDGTQLAADWTFSGLQKFGQGLLDRLRGQRLPNKLLERVNIVEIPGILEVRKQVSKYFPFNDACQWFIDRADIIFLVYDPSKLDVGPETEAILDQLKGREYQTRILLNKADQVKPEELLRVQSALIWNISPLMSSAQPPVMYTVSLWSNPFEVGAPVRLLKAQERTLLLDLGQAIDKRIENKIASARRFAVRVRNHAKMVDCYLTTYYNQKSLFGNKKQTAEKIIASPQDYHIYEGLSTLTNISRYDLPDPEVYRDFFHLNPLYEFKKLSETCTYFRGCPINKLDVAIAYDLPELVGKYKKTAEAALAKLDVLTPTSDFSKGKSSS